MNDNDRSIVGVAMLAHAMVHTYELSIPILVTVWLDAFSVTPATIGLVVSMGYGLFGLGALPGGILADTYGSRPLIIACLVGMGASFLLLSVAPSVGFVAVALLLWGAAASVYHPSGLSLISKGVSQRGTAFAYHGMAGNLGIALGPLATALLLLAFDWRQVTALLAIPAGVAVLLSLTVEFDETASVEATDGGTSDSKADTVSSLSELVSESRRLFTAGFAAVFAIVMCSGLYYRGTLTFLPDLLAGLPMFDPVSLGGRSLEPSRYLYAGLLMVGIAGQYAGGKLTDRMETERGIMLGFAGLAVVAVIFVPASNAGLVALLGVSAVLGFMLFLVQPFYQATVAEYTPAGLRGLSYGYTYLGVFGVGALGAAMAGVILTYASSSGLFLALAAIAVTAALLAGNLIRTQA
ncbi:MFS transporter [Halorussus sp. MSC15.2]|uniref:MFS transporter n=1 Tax=Halorussus sp. MSC15.2 TaxID=2283638 RepID=UPI0013D176BE|nr:MFS transporter [Halorussus sp. MSC15.2]NEU58814.1 MFS transporter [Halorussus sp. MSC15.2]